MSERPSGPLGVGGDAMAQQERAVVTRDKIVRSAATIFEQRGYANASLDVVASEAGVTKGALYHHFKSKEEVANAVIELQYEIAQSYGERVFLLGRTALERMMWMSQTFAQQMKDEVVVSAGVRLTTEAGGNGLEREAPYAGWIHTVEGLIAAAVEEGDIRADVDPTRLAAFLIPAYTGVQLVSDILHSREDLFQQLENMWTMLLIPALVPAERQPLVADLPARIMRSAV
ncbi:TetR/AcrR family transcriptional regulator [Curtobacterium sp. MCBD17_019]|nr:TetR/AcrR family transcriptional regulator [Curtobacterium sp. MCBD17_019]